MKTPIIRHIDLSDPGQFGGLTPVAGESQCSSYGIIGRDADLLDLERAIEQHPAGILIHGPAGIGKTTLCAGLIQRLAAADGLGNDLAGRPGKGFFWFSFQGIRSIELVFDEMAGEIFGSSALASGLDEKIEALVERFRQHRFIIVWDDFEAASEIPGSALSPMLSEEARGRLLVFLRGLHGGASKVLIASESEETWLGPAGCPKIRIGGLTGEDRREYCERIASDVRLSGLAIDRADPDVTKLMDVLDGNPLTMRVVLPRLKSTAPGPLMQEIESKLSGLASEDLESAENLSENRVSPVSIPGTSRGSRIDSTLFAALELACEGLSQELRPLLIPLALHRRFVNAGLLEAMARVADPSTGRGPVDRLMIALCEAGLLDDRGKGIYEMHTVVGRFLRRTVLDRALPQSRDPWCRALVDVMGEVAAQHALKELHEQRPVFRLLGGTFRTALAEAERLEIESGFAALSQSLGAYARNERDFEEARDLFSRLAERSESRGDQDRQAAAYHQLGAIAQEERDFAAAHQWYRKSLAIDEKLGNEAAAAVTYYQLGRIVHAQGNVAAAQEWYRKSSAIEAKQVDKRAAAVTYLHLWAIAQSQRDFTAAEEWYRKSLAISEKQGDNQDAAVTYQELGRIVEEQLDVAAAEQWYRKSLAIFQKQGNEHGAAGTYHQLGRLAALQEQLELAGRCFIDAHQRFRRSDSHRAQASAKAFFVVYQQADVSTRKKLESIWEEAGLGKLPEA